MTAFRGQGARGPSLRRAATALALAASASLGFGAQAGLAQSPPANPGDDAAPGEVLVRFEPSADAGERADLLQAVQGQVEDLLPVPGLALVDLEASTSVEEAASQLERSPEVMYAEPNFYRRAFAVPNDPSFSRLWGLHNTGQTGGTADADIDAPEAWDVTTGSADVVVAEPDTGVAYDHPDLSPNIWSNPGETGAGREANGRDDDGNGLVDDRRGWDWVSSDNAPSDENGHGTHVAGTIAAEGNDGRGVAGVAWESRVMPLRVLDATGRGTVAGVIEAYRYAAAKGAKVVNASLGSSDFSQAELDAINASPQTLFVVAAGNGGADGVGDDNAGLPVYPCTLPALNLICVAATDHLDALASFSNFGLQVVDLAAPGVSIYSTLRGGAYGHYSGTSMATPHVAGAAALLWARSPTASVAEVKAALLGGADVRLPLLTKVLTGGRLNARGALGLLLGPVLGLEPTTPSPRPAPEPAPSPGSSPQPAPTTQPAPRPSTRTGSDRVPPRTSVAVSRKRRLRRGVPVTVRCSERCSFRLELRLDGRTARRLRISRSARAVIVARGSGGILGAGGKTVRLKAGRRVARKLRRLRAVRLTLLVRAADGAGNTAITSRRIRLRT